MAYHISIELMQTVRQSPVRAALALVLLVATTVYVCTGHGEYRVAEVGQDSSLDDIVDLTSHEGWNEDIDLISTDEEDQPATSTRYGNKDQYADAQLTHAVAEMDAAASGERLRVFPVAGESVRRSASSDPVWLLGELIDE